MIPASGCSCGDPRHNQVVVKRSDLKKLLDYCRDDEKKHYLEYEKDARPKGHIYLTIRRLDRTVEQQVF